MSASGVAPRDEAMRDVVVIGGGLAGLIVARRLARAGQDVEVLEARNEPGGCVGALTLSGEGRHGRVRVTLDSGTESFSSNSESVITLLTELGLGSELTAPMPDGVWLATGNRPIRLPESGFLGIPGTLGDVRRTCGLAGAIRAQIDQLLPSTVGIGRPGRPTSLGRVVRSRLGRGVLARSVAPVVGNIHLTDPDVLDVDALMRELIDAGGRIRTDVRVERAVPSASSDGWHLTALGFAEPGTFEAAVGSRAITTVRARQIVFAGDAATVENVLGPVVPGLPRASARGGINIVTLLLEAPALDVVPRGTAVLVTAEAAKSTGVCAKALTHVSAKWAWLRDELPENTHVVRVSYGHVGSEPDAAEASSEALARTALHDASLLLGVRLTPQNLLDHTVTRFPPGLPYLAVGHADRVAQVRSATARLPGLHLTGAWIAGTGVGPVVTDAVRTAEDVLAATVPAAS